VLYSRFGSTGSIFSSFFPILSRRERLHNPYFVVIIILPSLIRALGDNIDLTNLECPVFSAELDYV
jgi:hypothetical protein